MPHILKVSKQYNPTRLSKLSTLLIAAISSVSLIGCGTMTGIPAHGGGKSFATEQRLVSASI